MSERDTAFDVRRLLVAVDASGCLGSTFATAAGLAARLGAELTGLFLEDMKLLQAASLPMTRYVSPLAQPGEFELSALEAELKALAARSRSALAAAAARANVAWSFSVLRGDPGEEIDRTAGPGDLIVVGPSGHIAGARLTSEPMLARAGERASGTMLLSRGRPHFARPLVLAHMDSVLVERAVAAAARLAHPTRPELEVLAIGGSDESVERLRKLAATILGEGGGAARVRRIAAASPAQLATHAVGSGNDLIVLEADMPLLAGDGTEILLRKCNCEILVVR